MEFLGLGEEFQSRHPGHVIVRDDDGEDLFLEFFERDFGVIGVGEASGVGHVAPAAGSGCVLERDGERAFREAQSCLDRLGQAQSVAPASADYRPTDPQVAWHLARFIEQVRSIPADPIIVRQNWLRAYDWTTDRGAAALNDYARANDPFTKVGKQQVAVEVSSVIRASADSFRVAWTERRYEDGKLSATERWTAILTIVVQPPRDAERLKANPLGIYINAISWSREMSQ